jgi:Rps23 Pro-64 3,4-dihydroxylase Tpa1-like proline 4-hydroxylase
VDVFKQMDIKVYDVVGFPLVVIDNFYSEKSCDSIWQELCFLNSDGRKLKMPEDTGGAIREQESETISLKKNKGLRLEDAYADRNISNIFFENRKIFDEEIVKKLESISPIFRYLSLSNSDVTIMHYYENNDYYLAHRDGAAITAVSWFYKFPKSFKGGNLKFENGLSIECIHNRTVIFPSFLEHSVDEIIMDQEKTSNNYGRYSLTHMIGVY